MWDTLEKLGKELFGTPEPVSTKPADQKYQEPKTSTSDLSTTVDLTNPLDIFRQTLVNTQSENTEGTPQKMNEDGSNPNMEGAPTKSTDNQDLFDYLAGSAKAGAVAAQKNSSKDLWNLIQQGKAFEGKSLFDIILQGQQDSGEPLNPSMGIAKAIKEGQFKDQFNQLLTDMLGRKVDVFGTLEELNSAQTPEAAKAIADKTDPQVLSILGTFGSGG